MLRIRVAVVACALVGLAGCGGGPKMAPVSGKVTYPDGSPVTGGQLILTPADPKLPSPLAEIDADGNFKVYTVKPGDGAQLGTYKVAVVAPGVDYSAKNPRPIDAKYADPATSELSITVEDKSNTVTLVVTRPGQKK